MQEAMADQLRVAIDGGDLATVRTLVADEPAPILVLDGFEVARQLRALPELSHPVHYLALSGFGQPQDFQQSLEAGFTHHLVKPADPVALDQILKTLLQEGSATSRE